jgi:hypothetical protein
LAGALMMAAGQPEIALPAGTKIDTDLGTVERRHGQLNHGRFRAGAAIERTDHPSVLRRLVFDRGCRGHGIGGFRARGQRSDHDRRSRGREWTCRGSRTRGARDWRVCRNVVADGWVQWN